MTVIMNKYRLIEKLGKGNFALTFKAENIRTKEQVAVKIESYNNTSDDNSILLLKHEASIYKDLKAISCVPSMRWYGKDDNFYYMVIDLKGMDLQTYMRNVSLTKLDKRNIMITLIENFQSIHEQKIIHRDIKPENILVDVNKGPCRLYIIDFGFATRHNDKNKERKTNNIIGTINYASKSAHHRHWVSYKDDLESLGYMYFYLLNNALPWPSNIDECDVLNLKTNFGWTEPFHSFMTYINSLNFCDIPNYKRIINIITI